MAKSPEIRKQFDLKTESTSKYTISLDKITFDDEIELKTRLEQNFGIVEVDVNLFDGILTVYYNRDRISEDDVHNALQTEDMILDEPLVYRIGRFLKTYSIVLRLAITLVLLSFSYMLLQTLGPETYNISDLKFIVINGIVVLLAYSTYYRAARDFFLKGRVTSHLLITVVTFCCLYLHQMLEAATVVFMALLAEAFEHEAQQRSRRGLSTNAILGTRTATVRRGTELEEVPMHKIQKGDIVVVRQGTIVPVDGQVISGRAEVRQSALTGESTYRTRDVGHKVFAGGMTVTGSIDVKAEKVGTETMLSNVNDLIKSSTQNLSRTERLIDRIAHISLAVLVIAFVAVTLLNGQYGFFQGYLTTHEAFQRGMAVLISLCPFALILATPMAMYLGVVHAARAGIIFKSETVIEKLAKMKILLMDKTGTLTHGDTTVTGVRTFGNNTEQEVIESALFVEQNSNHPMARAICAYAKNQGTMSGEADRFLEFEGIGASAMKGNRQIKVGSLRLMDDGRQIPVPVTKWLKENAEKGLATALVADMNDILGGFVFEDAIRSDAGETIKKLRSQGLQRIIMVTGDNRKIAARVQRQIGFDEVMPNCMPDTKLRILANEKRGGFVVGMVGDGINDAPALAAADVGIAMGAMGSDAAIEAADVALMTDELKGISAALSCSRKVMLTVNVSLAIAVIANLTLAAMALTGRINVSSSALFQMGIMIVVMITSLGLLAHKPRA